MKKKVTRIWLVGRIFLILVILVIAVALAGGIYLKSHLNKDLKDFVISSSDSLYRVEYDKLSLNLIQGSLTVLNLKLIPDTAVYQKMSEQNRAPRLLAGGEFRTFRVKNLLWWKFIRTKSLVANAIILDEPHVVLQRLRSSKEDTVPEKPFDLMQMLSRKIKNLEIESILLNKASVSYEYNDRPKKRRALIHLEKLDLFIDDIHIDFVKPGDTLRDIFADNYLLRLESYRYRTADSLYWLVWNGIEYNSNIDKAIINKFSIEPRYKEKDFWPRVKTRKERFEMTLNGISIEGVRASTLINDGELRASRITIPDGKWEIFQNMALPLPAVKRNICLSQKLMMFKFPFHIDTIHVSGVNLHFKQFEQKTSGVGDLTFENIKGNYLNVTNIADDINNNPNMKISLSARFMNASKLSADFNFLLNAEDGKFQMKAELEKTSATRLNRASVPLAKLEIENGTINKLTYHAKGNDRYATGNIQFLYDDLKLNFLEPDNEDGNLEKQGVKSFLAALFVVRQQNPGKGKEPRQAINITTTRHPRKGYFNMIWRTLFAGLKEIILVGGVKQDNKVKRAG
jgi:hypothetical protein